MTERDTSIGNEGPIGLLIFGRKRPGFDQDWSADIRGRCRNVIAALGFSAIGGDQVVLDDATVYQALDTMREAGCRALVVVQPSLADGQYALAVSQRWSNPVVLWATPERPGDGKVSSCALVGQHLWASILRQANHPFELIYGEPEQVTEELRQAILMADTVRRLRTAKIGMVGTHAPGFLDLAADPFLIRRTFGIQVQPLSLPQFIERVQSVPPEDVADDLNKVRALGLKASEGSEISDELLSVNSRFYVALRSLMKESSLDGLALQCWPELPIVLGQWPYLAVSRLGAEGQAVSIEGDLDGAIGALLGRMLGIGPGFLSDWLEHDEKTIFFWHPGMAPLDMCNAIGCDAGPVIGTHFNGAKPFVIDGSLQVGSAVTVSRIWRCDGTYHWTAFEGHAIPPRRRVTGNSLLVEVDGGAVPQRFDRLIHEGLPHHVTVHFDRHTELFRRTARLLGIEWHG